MLNVNTVSKVVIQLRVQSMFVKSTIIVLAERPWIAVFPYIQIKCYAVINGDTRYYVDIWACGYKM